MKRTLLFLTCMLVSVTMQAQDDPTDYIPFVELNKQWYVLSTNDNPNYVADLERCRMSDVQKRGGKTYIHMYRFVDVLCYAKEGGLYREENRRVFKYDEATGTETMLYDFSLKEGDIFTYEDFNPSVKCKVLKQGWLQDGPKIVSSCSLSSADTLDVSYRPLRTWTIGVDNGSGEYVELITWVEGVGTLENMFGPFYTGGGRCRLAYIEKPDDNRYNYLPFSFCNIHDPYIYYHGCNLPTSESNGNYDDRLHHLTYELEGERLHVYGDVYTQCGPNNYAFFYEKETDDPLVHMIEFVPWEVAPSADCMSHHATNFYVPGFDPNLNYYVLDNHGEKHPVINKTPKMAYRPMIEDGKVWKVGAVNSGNPVQLVEYYYFDGDTIIEGKTCKQMMRQRYVSPDFPEYDTYSQVPSLSYVGAWYEEDKKVYFYDATTKQLGPRRELMYDFSANAYDTLKINNERYMIGARETGGIKGFKGVYRAVFPCSDENNYRSDIWFARWLEGVGSINGPTTNIIDGQLADPAWFLMACTVGDEVIYLNDEFEDRATPELSNAPKSRFDFTHIIKDKPKAPKRRGADQSIYGEYNNMQLGINLNLIDDAYLIRITNETGKVVYEKAINAGNIVALNIDISSYPKGRYTVTVENSRESFTGQFDTIITGIVEVRGKKEDVRGYIYNLQGLRISSLQKGLNIVNGKKVYVK